MLTAKLIAAQVKAEKEAAELMKLDERDRPFNSGKRDFNEVCLIILLTPVLARSSHTQVTEKDMEAYRMKRVRDADPMAAFLGDGK